MQISSHDETQAHITGTCDCDTPTPAVDMPAAPSWATKNVDVDEDNGDRPITKPAAQQPAKRKVSEAEARRRRAARRKF